MNPFIEAEKVEQRNVTTAGALLEVCRPAFYECSTHSLSLREIADGELAERIEAYLATVIDLGSRRVVGWAIADHMRTELICGGRDDLPLRPRQPCTPAPSSARC